MSQAICELAQQGYGVQATCQAFRLPRASYYRLRQEPKLKTDPLRSQVRQVALEWSCYGYQLHLLHMLLHRFAILVVETGPRDQEYLGLTTQASGLPLADLV